MLVTPKEPVPLAPRKPPVRAVNSELLTAESPPAKSPSESVVDIAVAPWYVAALDTDPSTSAGIELAPFPLFGPPPGAFWAERARGWIARLAVFGPEWSDVTVA